MSDSKIFSFFKIKEFDQYNRNVKITDFGKKFSSMILDAKTIQYYIHTLHKSRLNS